MKLEGSGVKPGWVLRWAYKHNVVTRLPMIIGLLVRGLSLVSLVQNQ